MKKLDASAGSRQLRAAIRQAEDEPIVLTRGGKPVAAVVPIKGVDAETLKPSTSPRFLAVLRRSFAQLDSGRTLSLAEMRRRVG